MKLRERYKRLNFWNKIAFWGSIASIIAIPIAVVLWLFQAPINRDRPHVFFKMTKLSKPLTVGEKTTVEFILANSGQMEATGFISDVTYYFDVDPPEDSFEHQKSEPVSFSLSPTAEWNGQLRFPFVLTEEKLMAITNGRARLYFFAKGEYKDSQDRVYPLPFCRMYDPDMPGNLIICSNQGTFEQKEGSTRTNQGPTSGTATNRLLWRVGAPEGRSSERGEGQE